MGIETIAAVALPTVLGAMAGQGSGGSSGSQTQYRNIGTAGANEMAGSAATMDVLKQLQQFQGAGPGQADVAGGYQAQNQLAQMLQQYSQGGYAPTQADQGLARQQLAPQFEQARQNQVIGNQQFRQQAAVSGRGPMDFAFQNRLNQTMGNQMNMLAAQQSQIAAQQPMQRLGFMQDYANLKQGLASQAMQNRMAIANLGGSIRDSERNLRLGGASTTTNSSGQQGSQQGNMLMGGLAGLGTGLSMYNKFGGGGASGNTGSGGGYLGANTNLGYGQPMQSSGGGMLGANTNFQVGKMAKVNSAAVAPVNKPSANYNWPAFDVSPGSNPYGTQHLGVGLPKFMQSAFNVYPEIK